MSDAARRLCVRQEDWPIRGAFSIARGAKRTATVTLVTLTDSEGRVGRGEAVPYSRYRETSESVSAAIERNRCAIESGLGRQALLETMPAGAARSALDCAIWDLEAKQTGHTVWDLAGLPAPRPARTARTISLNSPARMAAAVRAMSPSPGTLIKVKLGAPDGDAERLKAVRESAPDSILVVDANEGWQADDLLRLGPVCRDLGVALLEQPLPAGADNEISAPVPLCADESLHGDQPFDALPGGYSAVNIKIDKAGGLTRALTLVQQAQGLGLDIFVGCMVATSLAMAPAFALAGHARWLDLDGGWLLAKDRQPGLNYDRDWITLPERGLWGTP